MQTFLPYPNFYESAKVLDYRRLGKQRVEAYQILNILKEKRTTGGWVNHPATKMWRGYEGLLAKYLNAMILEWKHRGYNNTMNLVDMDCYDTPPWLGDDRLHSSHRAALLAKMPLHYSQFGWTEKPSIEYYWPAEKG